MEWIYAACLAEEMARSHGVESVLSERIFTSKQIEVAFMHLHHYSILSPADRTVACGELREVRFDLKGNRATMTTAAVFLRRATSHLYRSR